MNKGNSSLEEVRQNIDQIDEEIIQLLSQRSQCVKKAAKYKKDQAEVNAPQRVEQIIKKVRKKAELFLLNPDIAENIYRTLIQEFINQEIQDFKNK